jgi:hypothetical protein
MEEPFTTACAHIVVKPTGSGYRPGASYSCYPSPSWFFPPLLGRRESGTTKRTANFVTFLNRSYL